MKKILSLVALVGVLMLSTGCSHQTVPTGTKGKVHDRSGWQPEVYPPSRVNVGMWGNLMLVETVTHTVNETVTIRMKDDMNLVAQVRFQLRMGEKQKSLDAIFNDIIPVNGHTITLKEVYNIYGKLIVNKVAREVLGQYNIADVNNNFAKISAEIYNRTIEEFKPTPLIITDVALGKLDYPDVIDRAIESAAKRELEIKQAEADVQVRLTELKGKEKVAEGEYRIKMQEAKRVRDYNKMIAKGITPELLELRRLEVQEMMASKIDKADTVFIPYGSLQSPGAQMRMYQK